LPVITGLKSSPLSVTNITANLSAEIQFHLQETQEEEIKLLMTHSYSEGYAIAQAVSRWLPTTEARVRALFGSCGICGGQSATGARFL
jgi:hypothetical protein